MSEPQESIKVLLVDDELDFLNSMAKALSRRGFDVRTAGSGSEGLATLEAGGVDVAVLDVKMPDLDGYELFRRAKESIPELAAIFLTGHGTIDDAFDLSKEGASDYLAKPVEPERLAEAIRVAYGEKAARSTAVTTTPPPEADAIRVLLVDDEEEFCQSMRKVLARRGFAVLTAMSAMEAERIMQSHPVDVAVLDIRMPGMDGHQLLTRIKEQHGSTEVILLTGHATVDSALEGMRQGAFDYLLKPQDPEELALRIREAAEKKTAAEASRRDEDIDDIIRRRPS